MFHSALAQGSSSGPSTSRENKLQDEQNFYLLNTSLIITHGRSKWLTTNVLHVSLNMRIQKPLRRYTALTEN